MSALLDVPPCPGSFDVLTAADGRLSAAGWLLPSGRTCDALDAYLDGAPVGPVRTVDRADVARACAWVGDARPSGFALETPLGAAAPPTRLDLVGRVGRTPVARLSSLLPSAADGPSAPPPDHLQERVSAFHGPVFRAQGLRMFTDLVDQMARRGIPTGGRILDWGCGCGRVAYYFATRVPEATLVGCDIDAEAVAWCREHLRGEFVHVAPMPPTPFADGSVDLILACSVLTHLTEAVQDVWLREMRRVLVPGGWFLASTQGEWAFQLAHRGRAIGKVRGVWRRLVGAEAVPPRLAGVKDSVLDPALDGIAPPGYYRGVFQSRAHTSAIAGRYFTVLDYVERGLNGHQDLVVLRRPK
jgi:SAM-dependent methyltransferase